MIRILLDQNFDHRISRGLLRRISDLDIESTERLGIKGFKDDSVLTVAAELERVVLTQDKKTFPQFAYKKIGAGEKMLGLVVVPDSVPIGEAIEQLELLIHCSSDDEWENSVIRLPI